MAIAIAVSLTGPAQAQTTSASPFQIVEASIDDIHTAFRSGRLTARQLVQGYLDRINAYDRQGPNINSVITINPDALAEADRLDAAFRTSGLAGPLHGIAILVKDEIDTAGMPTTLGTVVFKDYRPPKDAFVIDKLRKAGAIILGKATLSEFAAGDTYGSIFGVTRNLSVPKTKFVNNGGEGHRRPAPMRCGLGAGWHDGSVRLCPATDESSARCSKQHTSSGSDVSALRPGQSHGQRTRDESIRSVFRRSRSAKASLGQWACRGCPWPVIGG